MDIPFTRFVGWLKQTDSLEMTDIGKRAMDIGFPGFRRLEQPTDAMRAEMQQFRQRGVDYIAWRDRPHRRFAGYDDLPRGRYYTVTQGSNGNDNGTLIRELLAYHDPLRSGLLLVVDLATTQGVEMLAKIGADVEKMNALVILFMGRPGARSPFISSFSDEEHDMYGIGDQDLERTVVPVSFPYQVVYTTIDRTIDLRLPSTQEWFFHTFAGNGTEYYRKI